jgi:hypothetical protein
MPPAASFNAIPLRSRIEVSGQDLGMWKMWKEFFFKW